MNYSAVFTPNEHGGYNVSFPDFPGCVTFGKNMREAREKAREVLELWLEELHDKGEDMPEQSGQPIVGQIEVAAPV